MDNIGLADLLTGMFDYIPTLWHDKVVDPEGDNSHPGVKFTARRANNLEEGVDLAHERLNNMVKYTNDSDKTQKNLRFEFLLLKASVASGLTSNIFVDNFESLEGIELATGMHDPDLQRVYLP
jgi:hypothetical protein